eukprot:TRINITY_DN12885_c0_g1_i3.p1 TRINITY_DN12885_c0_g1~~TRINITY_DN12885_c0_g1_i3.p1  ORF type:complete len:189 (+),score=21.87 TRINITY_DN12885_c0_g1_i3:191-757(+)
MSSNTGQLNGSHAAHLLSDEKGGLTSLSVEIAPPNLYKEPPLKFERLKGPIIALQMITLFFQAWTCFTISGWNTTKGTIFFHAYFGVMLLIFMIALAEIGSGFMVQRKKRIDRGVCMLYFYKLCFTIMYIASAHWGDQKLLKERSMQIVCLAVTQIIVFLYLHVCCRISAKNSPQLLTNQWIDECLSQ